jgi:hypothetical protein
MTINSAQISAIPTQNRFAPRRTGGIVRALFHRRKQIVAAALLACAFAGGTAAQEAPLTASGEATLTKAELKEHVAWLAGPELRGRGAGTKYGRRTAEYIRAEFERLGFYPAGTDRTWYQDFPLGKNEGTGRNVLGLLLGTDDAVAREVVIISAHYDHLGMRVLPDGRRFMFPGADDNASGVATMLELAEAFAKQPTRRSILFAAWDGEEGGLRGSRYYTDHPTVALEKLAAMTTMDMLSRDFLGVMENTLYVIGAERSDVLRRTVNGVQAETSLQLDVMGAELIGPRSDHFFFMMKQVPILFFSTSEHRDYHQPTDTPANADLEKHFACTRAIYKVLRRIGDGDARPEWREKAHVGIGEVKTMLHVGEAVLANKEKFVFQTNAVEELEMVMERCREVIKRGTITAGERMTLGMQGGVLLMRKIREKR